MTNKELSMKIRKSLKEAGDVYKRQGWNWVESTEGSGFLLSPEGDSVVDYVLIIGTSDIRYRFRDTESWMLFVGTEKEFKDFILKKVRDRI